jgi:hypothetical protein
MEQLVEQVLVSAPAAASSASEVEVAAEVMAP